MTDHTQNDPKPRGERQHDDETERRRAEVAKELGYFPATLIPKTSNGIDASTPRWTPHPPESG